MKSAASKGHTDKLQKDMLDRTDELISQVVKESQGIEDISGMEAEIGNRRNELLLKLHDQIDNIRQALRQTEEMEKRLKKSLNQLESLRRILAG